MKDKMTRKKFVMILQENLFWKKKYTLDYKEEYRMNGESKLMRMKGDCDITCC